MYTFDGKVVVVTGASNGIGAEIAGSFAQRGATVILNFLSNVEKAQKIKSSCEAAGGTIVLQQGSVADNEFVKKMFKDAVNEFGKIDFLINNAGINKDGLLMTAKINDINQVINTNLLGTINCCKMIMPHMINFRTGKIINISSVAGIKGALGQTIYASTKAGIIGFTKSLAIEAARYNIHVNSISPGFINTDMSQKLSVGITEKYTSIIPLGKFGECADIANMVRFMCSDECNYMIGHNVIIDGGMTS